MLTSIEVVLCEIFEYSLADVVTSILRRMTMNGPTSRKRSETISGASRAEDLAFSSIIKEAEARHIQRKETLRQARELRMKELERLRKKENGKDIMSVSRSESTSSASSRCSTKAPLDTLQRILNADIDPRDLDLRQLRKAFVDLLELYRSTMSTNVQLQNEKSTLIYEVDLLKDESFETAEEFAELKRQHKEQGRELESFKRNLKSLTSDYERLKLVLEDRENIIREAGLSPSSESNTVGDASNSSVLKSLLSAEILAMLDEIEQDSIEDKLRTALTQRFELQSQVDKLKSKLMFEGRRMNSIETSVESASTGKQNKDVNDLRNKVQRLEQELSSLQTDKSRLESQNKHYKEMIAVLEKNEDDIKDERRRLQRELRDAKEKAEELSDSNKSLKKRLDKLRELRKNDINNAISSN